MNVINVKTAFLQVNQDNFLFQDLSDSVNMKFLYVHAGNNNVCFKEMTFMRSILLRTSMLHVPIVSAW